ncbi:MAG TPA: hypothetical protein VNO43_09225 [Candidatus Eisenbacteria bacterium]|nr:hypothetical protein [Candidatus Eisenbacteria bacterium]
MRSSPVQRVVSSPEALIERVYRRLWRHVAGDWALAFGPLALAAGYLVMAWYRAPSAVAAVGALVGAGLALLAMVIVASRARPRPLSIRSVARLIDQTIDACDRFLTLATIDSARSAEGMLARLREEAGALARRLDLRRDFPYRIKRSCFWSVTAAAIALAVFYLVTAVGRGDVISPADLPHALEEMAEKLARRPSLAGLAGELESLAARLQEPHFTAAEKQQLIAEMRTKIEQRQQEQPGADQKLLSEAASALKGLEGESGQEQQQKRAGGGGLQSSLPERGQGQEQPGEGGSRSETDAQMNPELQNGGEARSEPDPMSRKSNQRASGTETKQDGREPSAKDQGQELKGKGESGVEEPRGPSKSEGKGRAAEKPEGTPPPERFLKPGEEGKASLKGAGYITVQLPEELVNDGKSQGGGTREGKPSRARPSGSISNVPLPAHVPDAPSEKQNLPLEYRGIIR